MRLQTMLKDCLAAVAVICLAGLTYLGGYRMILWSIEHYNELLTFYHNLLP